MRHVFCTATLLTLLIGNNLYANTTEENTMEEIAHVIEQFKLSGDQQRKEIADSVLHKDFSIFYLGKDGWVTTTKEAYLGALERKVIGGTERASTIKEINVSGSVASAQVQFRSDQAVFDQFVNLVKVDDSWQIASIVLNFQPVTAAE